jgi:hypothetical protein
LTDFIAKLESLGKDDKLNFAHLKQANDSLSQLSSSKVPNTTQLEQSGKYLSENPNSFFD